MTEPVQITEVPDEVVEVIEETPLTVLVEETEGETIIIQESPEDSEVIISIPGPPGPPGPPGASTPSYTHPQDLASDTWVMDHGLGKKPYIVIEDTAGTIMEANLEYPTLDRAIAYHSAPFSGMAYLS